MEYPGVRLGQRGGLYDLYQYYLGGGDQATGDEGPVTTVSMPVTTGGGGGGQTNSMGVDSNRIKQPTGSPFTSFEQNRADAGAGYYGSPQYTGGFAGDITQTGPGREFIYDPSGRSYDDKGIMTGVEEDPGFLAKIREGILDNPLFAAASSFASPFVTAGKSILDKFGEMLPINMRAITEQQGLQQGTAIDDIGRVAFQDFGIREDGTYGALSRDDPRNIFAGLNYSMIDQSTIDKMKNRLNKTIAKTTDENKLNTYRNRLKIIDQAWSTKQKVDDISKEIYRKKKNQGFTKGTTAGPSGFIGLSKGMDVSIQDYDDAGTYVVPKKTTSTVVQDAGKDRRTPTPKSTPKKSSGSYSRSYNPGAGGVVQHSGGGGGGGGGGSTSSKSASKSTRGNNPWGRKDGGLVTRKPYGDGGIVDLL